MASFFIAIGVISMAAGACGGGYLGYVLHGATTLGQQNFWQFFVGIENMPLLGSIGVCTAAGFLLVFPVALLLISNGVLLRRIREGEAVQRRIRHDIRVIMDSTGAQKDR